MVFYACSLGVSLRWSHRKTGKIQDIPRINSCRFGYGGGDRLAEAFFTPSLTAATVRAGPTTILPMFVPGTIKDYCRREKLTVCLLEETPV